MKSATYRIQSPGIGYQKNVDAIEQRLRAILNVSDVSRMAIAQIIWGSLVPSISNEITFTTQDIEDAVAFLIHDLQIGV